MRNSAYVPDSLRRHSALRAALEDAFCRALDHMAEHWGKSLLLAGVLVGRSRFVIGPPEREGGQAPRNPPVRVLFAFKDRPGANLELAVPLEAFGRPNLDAPVLACALKNELFAHPRFATVGFIEEYLTANPDAPREEAALAYVDAVRYLGDLLAASVDTTGRTVYEANLAFTAPQEVPMERLLALGGMIRGTARLSVPGKTERPPIPRRSLPESSGWDAGYAKPLEPKDGRGT